MAASMAEPSEFGTLEVKFDENSNFSHTVFFKKNKTIVQDPEKPAGRTLLVLNIPPYCREYHLRRVFAQRFGSVDAVFIQEKLTTDPSAENFKKSLVTDLTNEDAKFFATSTAKGFCCGFVVFSQPDSLTRTVESPTQAKPIILSKPERPIPVGMRKWVKEYQKSFPDKKELQSNIDEYMAKYDKAVEISEMREKEMEDIPDEEGWVKVTRKGKNPVIARTELNEMKAKRLAKMKKKKRELLNVYSYQIRESKREKIAELRQKFEEDKQRIQEMREARKFRPF